MDEYLARAARNLSQFPDVRSSTGRHTQLHALSMQCQTAEHMPMHTCSYYVEVKAKRDADLIVMDTDACIFEDEGFRCAFS